MDPDPWAAVVFAATFLLLAAGRLGRLPLPRGPTALAGGLLTAALYGLGLDVVDWQVIALLAGLTVLAALAEWAGLFAGVRRHLARRSPPLALWLACLLVAGASALLLNDAAVVVLVPFLLPALRAQGLPLPDSVALLAVAANVGSLLTPFGNPQNAALARHAGLGVLDFLRVQGPIALAGLLAIGLAAGWVGRKATPQPVVAAPLRPRGRLAVAACAALFLALAATGRVPFGAAALLCAGLAHAALRIHGGSAVDRAAWRGLDWNVLLLFLGLYPLTAGLPRWFPADRVPLGVLDAVGAASLTVLLSNVVGNVPAMLALIRVDPAWTALHAPFLVAVSTLGGALLLTGSAASLLAADQARRHGVEVGFWAFARVAACIVPVLLLAAWLTWPAAP
ncbi:MAG TPA: SLC13 family permease [Candidatus Thermoplasmatota archaeon]|nr:SLC13 family permease [Candidatus Thermoplasmatota archaeon]